MKLSCNLKHWVWSPLEASLNLSVAHYYLCVQSVGPIIRPSIRPSITLSLSLTMYKLGELFCCFLIHETGMLITPPSPGCGKHAWS